MSMIKGGQGRKSIASDYLSKRFTISAYTELWPSTGEIE